MVFTSVTYGDSYLLAGQSDGSTWAWGFNQYAQWGNGNYYATNDNGLTILVNAEFSFSPTSVSVDDSLRRGATGMNLEHLPMTGLQFFCSAAGLGKGRRLTIMAMTVLLRSQHSRGFSSPKNRTAARLAARRQHTTFALSSGQSRCRLWPDAGGSPLYVRQPYRFGVFAGAYDEEFGPNQSVFGF